jgi:hypothetical protein
MFNRFKKNFEAIFIFGQSPVQQAKNLCNDLPGMAKKS